MIETVEPTMKPTMPPPVSHASVRKGGTVRADDLHVAHGLTGARKAGACKTGAYKAVVA